jgi:hypothetical protein
MIRPENRLHKYLFKDNRGGPWELAEKRFRRIHHA